MYREGAKAPRGKGAKVALSFGEDIVTGKMMRGMIRKIRIPNVLCLSHSVARPVPVQRGTLLAAGWRHSRGGS